MMNQASFLVVTSVSYQKSAEAKARFYATPLLQRVLTICAVCCPLLPPALSLFHVRRYLPRVVNTPASAPCVCGMVDTQQ